MPTPIDLSPIRALYLPMFEADDRRDPCAEIISLCEPLLGTTQHGRSPEFVELLCAKHVGEWLQTPADKYDPKGVEQARQLKKLALSKSYLGHLLIWLMLIEETFMTEASRAAARQAGRAELPLLAVNLNTPAADVELGNQILDLIDRLSNKA